MEKSTKQQLSIQEWETLIEDFQFSPSRRKKWLSQHPPPSILELALASVVRKEFSLKTQVIIFLEENFDILVREESVEDALGSLVESLRAVVQAPVDGVSVTYTVKEQMIVSVASIFVSADAVETAPRHLEGLVELLLTIINRPNHGPDRQTRAVACECLRELERANSCLLVEIAPHLWTLCQNERTHASQSYLLLLTSVILNLIRSKIYVPILSTSLPLIPFNIPVSLVSTTANNNNSNSSGRDLNFKEIRRVVAFLLEQPQILTPCGMMEFIDMIMEVGSALELQVSLLKVQFSGLLYSYDPVLSHVVLTLYSRFSDAFEGQEREIARRLVLKSKEMQQHLVFRLLALHWLLGFPVKKELLKKRSIMQMVSSLYPTVFDPLALKALKLDSLAYIANCLDFSKSEEVPAEVGSSRISAVTLFEEGLICVSSFKWLPLWSTETMVAFRAIHKFLIGSIPHSSSDTSSAELVLDSAIFRRLQNFIVNTSMEFRRLVPVLVSFVDRLLGCHSHRWLGELLLQTLDERLLPKLANNHHLASYFPIFNRIAKDESIPPRSLLELLTSYVSTLVESHGPDTGLRSWSHGSKILGICRAMLMHHHSSRVFIPLSHLLAFTCQFFPDLEIRDNARIYLRMVVCVPGKKLRYILNLGEQLPGVSPSPPLSSFFQSQSPQTFSDKKLRDISLYIHLDRLNPLLIKQSWSLTIPTFGTANNAPYYFGGIRDGEPPTGPEADKEVESSSEVQSIHEIEKINSEKEPPRVMNTKVSEVLQILRRHFTSIPDFRHITGLKIRIPCILTFESEPFNRIWGTEKSTKDSPETDSLPALYAIIVSFSSSAPYGSIPKFHVPFLLGQPSRQSDSAAQKNQLDIVPSQNGSDQVAEDEDNEKHKASVLVELEPREPMPGLVDIGFEANGEDGRIIQGSLQSIMVGIEDMFQKAPLPPDILEDSALQYFSDLFSALWMACGNTADMGREIFPLKGGKGVATINGTQSVKLLNVSSDFLIQSVEFRLAPFVTSVIGHPLVDIIKDGRIIKDTVFKDGEFSESSVLQLKYRNDASEIDGHNPFDINREKLGTLHVLIFLPPRYHLLFQMEVSELSTLVRIRTDHWPCLAYVDDYLEALFSDVKS